MDDCGNPVDSGAVIASFSNGDLPLAMQPVSGGRWHGTWQVGSASTGDITVKVEAEDRARGLAGTEEFRLGVRENLDPPVLTAEGVLNLTSSAAHQPLALGGIVSLYGANLATGDRLQASRTPLPARLGETDVLVAGRRAPLFFVSSGQVNAQIPFDIEPNISQQIVLRRGRTYSLPVQVNVAPASPGLMRQAGRQALAVVVREGEQFLNGPGSGARAGDTLVVYATGLGPTFAPVTAGESAPASPPAEVAGKVMLSVGGIEFRPVFAGLTPGYSGLYQLNFVLPAGIPPGQAVAISVSVDGLQSEPATLAVE